MNLNIQHTLLKDVITFDELTLAFISEEDKSKKLEYATALVEQNGDSFIIHTVDDKKLTMTNDHVLLIEPSGQVRVELKLYFFNEFTKLPVPCCQGINYPNPMHTLPAHIRKVIEDKKALDNDILKLKAYVCGGSSGANTGEAKILAEQLVVMINLSDIYGKRISLYK